MTQEAFKAWWYNEGSQALYTHHDCEEHTMRMCEIAWNKAQALAQPERHIAYVCPQCYWTLEEQPEPMAFYVYKPTLPRGHLGNVSDGDLPWVYDQDPSSGYSARMLVYTTPPSNSLNSIKSSNTLDDHRKPLTDEQIEDLYFDKFSMSALKAFARAIEAAHGIKENT